MGRLSYLHKQRHCAQVSDEHSVVHIPGQYVQSADCSFNDLFHAYTIGEALTVSTTRLSL